MTKVTTITNAVANDETAVTKLHALLYANDYTKTAADFAQQIREAIKNKLVWVAKSDQQIVGYILCELFGDKHRYFPNSVFIHGLLVNSPYRARGIGKNLVKTVLQHKFPEQYTYFSVTHDPAIARLTHFYQSLGFKTTGTTAAGNIMLVKTNCG
jgi:predicted N-acetyltransferase YhbS